MFVAWLFPLWGIFFLALALISLWRALSTGQMWARGRVVVTRQANPGTYWWLIAGNVFVVFFALCWLAGVGGIYVSDTRAGRTPFANNKSACAVAYESDYGYSERNPIRVGGGTVNGPRRAAEYVHNLFADQAVIVIGKSGYVVLGNTTLDFYEIKVAEQRQLLYFDYAVYETPRAPSGLKCRVALTFAEP